MGSCCESGNGINHSLSENSPNKIQDINKNHSIKEDDGSKEIEEIKPQIQLYKNFNCKKTIKEPDIITFLIELNNKKLMSGSSNGNMKIWNLYNFEFELLIKEDKKILCLLEFEPNMVLCGTQSKSINLWNLNNPNEKIDSFKGHLLSVNCLVKCNDKYFASASNDKDIRIWNYSLRKCERILKGHTNNIFCLIKSHNNLIYSGSADKTVKRWNWEKGECEGTFCIQSWVKSLCQLSDGRIISGSDDKIIQIWYNYKQIMTFIGHKDSIKCLCNIDNSYLASGSFDKTIKIWDLKNGECLQTLEEHNDKVICLLKHSLGYLISCSNDRTIKFWKQD